MSYKPEYMWLCGKNTAVNSIVAQVYAISKDCIQSIYKCISQRRFEVLLTFCTCTKVMFILHELLRFRPQLSKENLDLFLRCIFRENKSSVFIN